MTRATQRTPPHSIEAEEAVISCCLIDASESVSYCIEEGITQESFYDPALRVMFDQICRLVDEKKPCDEAVLAESLHKAQLLESVGGMVRINQITNRIPTTAHRKYYIEEIRSCETRRKLIAEASLAIERAYDCQGDSQGLVDEVQSRILGISANAANGSVDGMDSVIEDVGQLVSNYLDGKPTGAVKTGFVDLDNLTFGLQPSEMTIIGARPSCGKTALALNIADYISTSKDGGDVLFFSLEMSKGQLGFRMLTSRARVRSDKIKRAQIGSTGAEIDRLRSSMRDLRKARVWIDDSSFQTVNTIRARARNLHKKLEPTGGLKVVMVDYLQLVSTSNNKESREQQVAGISKGLKALAKELALPVVVLSQLNRKATDGAPRLSELRESGSLEQDADVVLLLYPEKQEQDGEHREVASETMNLDIAKQRNGPCQNIQLTFLRDITRFENSTRF